jgi:drug/metabolite transporter superfamily protein YnfA
MNKTHAIILGALILAAFATYTTQVSTANYGPIQIAAAYTDGNVIITYTLRGNIDATVPIRYDIIAKGSTTPLITQEENITFTAPETNITAQIPAQLDAGTYIARVTVNPYSTIAESDYNNNVGEAEFKVASATTTGGEGGESTATTTQTQKPGQPLSTTQTEAQPNWWVLLLILAAIIGTTAHKSQNKKA